MIGNQILVHPVGREPLIKLRLDRFAKRLAAAGRSRSVWGILAFLSRFPGARVWPILKLLDVLSNRRSIDAEQPSDLAIGMSRSV